MRGLHRAILLTILAGITSVAYAQEEQTPIDPPQKTILAAPIAELPLELDARGRPVIIGRINGQGPYRLAIDWGANAFAISEGVVQDLALSTGDITFDNGQEVKASSINSLVLGEATLEGLSAIVVGFLDTPGINLDGVLGINVFADLLMTFDFPAKTVRLEKGTLPSPNGEDILALVPPEWGPFVGQIEGVRPHVRMQLGEYSAAATLDTQGASWLSIPDSLMPQFKLLTGPVKGAGWGPTMGEMDIQKARVEAIMQVGNITVSNPTVFFRNRPSIVLGAPFLSQFAITLDQKSHTVRFQGYSGDPIEVPPADWETDVPEEEQQAGDRRTEANSMQYVGIYEIRTVTFEDGALYLQRNDVEGVTNAGSGRRVSAPKLKMVPVSEDEFTLERVPTAQIKFGRDARGNVVALHVLNREGKWEVTKRDGP